MVVALRLPDPCETAPTHSSGVGCWVHTAGMMLAPGRASRSLSPRSSQASSEFTTTCRALLVWAYDGSQDAHEVLRSKSGGISTVRYRVPLG